jgi:hypothetical protein
VEIGGLQNAQFDDWIGRKADFRQGREGGGRHTRLKDPRRGDWQGSCGWFPLMKQRSHNREHHGFYDKHDL